jgi:hypothetical protein
MPGFIVDTFTGPIGGKTGNYSPRSTEYYYSYTWEIFKLFEDIHNSALIHARDIDLPTFSANMDSIVGASLEYKWAKSVVWDDIKITWYDTVGLIEVMKKWRKTIWSQDKGLQVGSEYKKMSEISVYDSSWDNEIRWKLIGSWPKIIKHGSLTYTQSDVKLVEVTLSYDWAEENEEYSAIFSRRNDYVPRRSYASESTVEDDDVITPPAAPPAPAAPPGILGTLLTPTPVTPVTPATERERHRSGTGSYWSSTDYR